MNVLQKWNRGIPNGTWTATAVLFFLLFIFLKQFYLFPSGGMEAADVCLFASFFMLLCDCMRRRPERLLQLKTESLFYGFLASVVVINTYYGIRLGRGEFFRYTCFWIFNACAIWSFCYLTEYGGKAFLTEINRVVKVNIGVQLLIYLSGHGRIFREYWGAVRYQGTFNDPNQLAFFLFMMILLLYLYRCRFGDRSFPVFYVLALPVIAASKSTGILLGVFVFTILAVLYGLYQIGCKKGVSVKVWILGICMGVLIFSLFLWWIWPAADFDVKTVDYNMLTRIQEKIWKVAHGGLLGLFLDRGMEKLVLYPQYLLYGAGEGGFDRFTLASQVNEIHCCLFSVMFCYGLIPTSCLLVWLGRKLRRIDAAMTCAVIGLLAESFFLVNYRQPMFWMILLYGSVAGGCRGGDV